MGSEVEPRREELLLLLSAKDATIKSLTKLVEQLAVRVAELERQRGKDSSNSSKPPSSDTPFAKPAPKRSSRTRSGRRPGKQDGTPGTTLRRVEDPDETLIRDPLAAGAVTPRRTPRSSTSGVTRSSTPPSLRRAPGPPNTGSWRGPAPVAAPPRWATSRRGHTGVCSTDPD